MGQFRTLYIPEYTTDFETQAVNVPFKISERFLQLIEGTQEFIEELIPDIDLQAPRGCGGNNKPFNPRYVELITTDGDSFKCPTTSYEAAANAAVLVQNSDNFACMHYFGESWGIVPAGIANTQYQQENLYSKEVATVYNTYSFSYTSDAIGEIELSGRSEANPDEMYQVAISALVDFNDEGSTCSTSGIVEPRYFTAMAEDQNGGMIRRKVKVSQPGDVPTALQNFAESVRCAGWQGEIVRNLNELV